jgi:hypothetical protein
MREARVIGRRRRLLRVLVLEVLDVLGWINVVWQLEPWKLWQRRTPAPAH